MYTIFIDVYRMHTNLFDQTEATWAGESVGRKNQGERRTGRVTPGEAHGGVNFTSKYKVNTKKQERKRDQQVSMGTFNIHY